MKMIIAALALVAVAAAASVPELEDAILRSKYDLTPEGGYEFSFETEKGNYRSESGDLKEVLDEENKPHTVVAVRGSYGYTDNEGNVEKIDYFADETGYHAEGPSVPKNSRR